MIGAGLFLGLLLSVLAIRLITLQIFDSDELAKRARAHYEHEQPLEARRGRIYDRHGELLACDQVIYTLVADCRHLRDPGLASIGLAKKENAGPRHLRNTYQNGELQERYLDYVVEVLSKASQLSPDKLSAKLRSKEKGELVLARHIEADYRRQLEEILDSHAIGGIYLRKSHQRIYPSPSSLTQVLGYVSSEHEGKAGVEKVFDQAMRGIDGLKVCERDRQRREILAYRKSKIDPVPGRDVHLTIDMALQSEIELQLDSLMATYQPEKISTIWLRPQTGEVLAMASRPHFDLETRVGTRRNIAVTDLYEPGSTFKVVAFGAALDRGIISRDTLIDCHYGAYDAEGFAMKDHAPYGELTAEMVLAKSSNIGTYLAVKPLGEQVFHRYMSLFGFGKKSGIALTAESAGAIYPVNQWNQTSFSSKAIGYEVMVTPLQMAAACAVVANGGIYRSPVLIQGLSDGDNAPLEPVARSSTRRVISQHAAKELTEYLVTAARDGTGRRAAIPGYTVAGKTGTARKHVENVGYVEGRYVVSYMGFLPAHDPQLVGLIVIDDPQSKDKNLYGGTIAAPAFRSIAEEAVKILRIEPDQAEKLTAISAADKVAAVR